MKFVILGLPRSGTTYLAELLQSHSQISCAGERFNPHAIIGLPGQRVRAMPRLIARDKAPARAAEAFFDDHGEADRASGFKVMIGHHPELLRYFENQPDIRIIHVWRENRLAQAESLVKAIETKIWADSTRNGQSASGLIPRVRHKLRNWLRSPPKQQQTEAAPLRAARIAREAETQDFLVHRWLSGLENPVLTVEYRHLVSEPFRREVCDFLSVDPMEQLQSSMRKQGDNRILDRFAEPEPIARYFSAIGRATWLGDEL